MKNTLLLSAALLALLAGPALAQRGEHGRGGGERGGPPAAAAPAPQAPAPQAPAPRAAPANRAEVGRQSMQRQQAQRSFGDHDRSGFSQRGGDHRPDFNRGGSDHRPDFNRGDDHRGGFDRRDDRRPDFRRGDDRRDFGRNDRYDRRPGGFQSGRDWSRYHRSFNASHRFHFRGGGYRRPAGWYYRRWTYGDFLPSLFWGSNYWIDDFSYYDLMPPPAGTVWVRYGDDALLIDRYSGEVIQVEYGIFF